MLGIRVSLCQLFPDCPALDQEIVTAGLPAWVEIGPTGSRVVTATAATPHKHAAPVGFSGTLTVELLQNPRAAQRVGFSVGSDFDGFVTVCTTTGSATIRTPTGADLLSLGDILGGDPLWPVDELTEITPRVRDWLRTLRDLLQRSGTRPTWWALDDRRLALGDATLYPAEMDKHCPWFLVFAGSQGTSIARLALGPGYAREYDWLRFGR